MGLRVVTPAGGSALHMKRGYGSEMFGGLAIRKTNIEHRGNSHTHLGVFKNEGEKIAWFN